jgi:hypothetical protein
MARYGARRPQNLHDPRPVITIVCDDTKTAGAYLRELKREVKSRRTVNIVPAPRHGADGKSVVEYAGSHKPEGPEPNDQVWALIDLDTNPRKHELRDHASRLGVQIAFSAPCFEIFTLAHLEDTGAGFTDCSAVITRIKAMWKAFTGVDFPQKKAQADYSRIIPLCNDAIARCSKRSEANSQSWTEVWKVVEAILAK